MRLLFAAIDPPLLSHFRARCHLHRAKTTAIVTSTVLERLLLLPALHPTYAHARLPFPDHPRKLLGLDCVGEVSHLQPARAPEEAHQRELSDAPFTTARDEKLIVHDDPDDASRGRSNTAGGKAGKHRRTTARRAHAHAHHAQRHLTEHRHRHHQAARALDIVDGRQEVCCGYNPAARLQARQAETATKPCDTKASTTTARDTTGTATIIGAAKSRALSTTATTDKQPAANAFAAQQTKRKDADAKLRNAKLSNVTERNMPATTVAIDAAKPRHAL